MAAKEYTLPTATEYDGMTLLKTMADAAADVIKMDTTTKDVYIATYPRSGTTWLSEVMSLILFDGDIEATHKVPRFKRVFFLEMETGGAPPGVQIAKSELGNPRVLMTHLSYKHMQKQVEENKSKMVVVVRNPRDVLVSMYHFYQNNPGLGSFAGTWDQFFEGQFKSGKMLYGDWLKHVKDLWQVRHLDNVHWIHYEDAVDDLRSTVEKLAIFMGKELPPEVLQRITDESQFSSMQNNAGKIFRGSDAKGTPPGIQKTFFRQGKYGGWVDYFSPEQDNYVKELYDNPLQELGIVLKSQSS